MPLDKEQLEALRANYQLKRLNLEDTQESPLEQFATWFEEALNSALPEPNAMTLATASPSGRPSARIVLLKGVEEGSFVFYTNYESHKGRELDENPQAALVFLWLELQRQVRIEGTVERLSPEASSAYFHKRPKGSQIGAWASPQSSIIEDRGVLIERQEELEEKYKETDELPRPPHWGGYRVIPSRIEFWQGRPNRLHDRVLYTKTEKKWKRERLAP